MASKKEIKKEITDVISDIVEEAYSFQLFNPGKKDKEVNALIDRSVEILDDLLQKVNSGKNVPSGKESKLHYSKIREELGKQQSELRKAVHKLG